MRIAFDAKRAYNNYSGLGNYSRSTIELLSTYYPENEYLLFTPSLGNDPIQLHNNQSIITPTSYWKNISSLWRSYGMKNELNKLKPTLYHGLSNELPFSIKKTRIPSVVTIHDLIFIKHPELYPFVDRLIYNTKFQYSCNNADTVIAISEATKEDIISELNIPAEKIQVAYQTCNQIFAQKVSNEEKERVKHKYKLPSEFILNVGTIEKRKNALNILKAAYQMDIKVPIIIIGKATPYLKEIREYINAHGMQKQVMIMHHVETIDLPAIYQSAEIFVFPSHFEGFGIPILEAMYSGTPVITSKGSCFLETACSAALYASPNDANELGQYMLKVMQDTKLKEHLSANGFEHVKNFSPQKTASRIYEIYNLTLEKK